MLLRFQSTNTSVIFFKELTVFDMEACCYNFSLIDEEASTDGSSYVWHERFKTFLLTTVVIADDTRKLLRELHIRGHVRPRHRTCESDRTKC